MIADAAVVGGGIAGAAACIALRRAGLSATWIDPGPGPNGDRAGDSLAPAAGPILTALGLGGLLDDGGHRPANASFSAWGSDRLVERHAAVHLEGPGRVIDRRRFEADIRARTGGVTVRHGRLAAATVDGATWRLALSDGGTVAARFLVDASGRSAVAARSLARRRRDDRMVAACAFLPHGDATVEPTPATLIEATADGWWYAALLPDRRLSLAWFSDPDLMPRGLSRSLAQWRRTIGGSRHVAHWIADAGFRIDTPPRLESAGTTWLEPAAGVLDGAAWAAIGDAAAAFDPLSSHGMTTALWAAARMAAAVPAWLTGDATQLAGYAGAVADGIAAFRKQRAAIYGSERRFGDAPFWRRRDGSPPTLRGSRRAG